MNDKLFMRRALELAERGKGSVSPNPLVGCVIVKDERIIGEGWHEQFGGPHAERVALANATESVHGATMYVSLEPCNHTGKTPPCTEAIIEHNISRVVIGAKDPNPVAGGGEHRLREAGIDVQTGVLEAECTWMNRYFMKFISTGKPYVVAKIAQSLDGCIATGYGESKWITSAESRRHVHKLRAEIDAVVVGQTTVAKDDPELTVRDVPGRNPYRIVLDSKLSLPLRMRLFMLPDRERTMIFCKSEVATSQKAQTLALTGIKVIGLDRPTPVSLDLDEFLTQVGKRNISSVLVEGGAKVFSSFVKDNLIDELHVFVAPKILGNGKQVFSGLSVPSLRMARQFTYRTVLRSGDDIHIIAVR